MNRMDLWGLTGQFAAFAREHEGLSAGRVISQEKNIYRVVHEKGEQYAVVSGKFRYEAKTVSDFPSVGDFVMLTPAENGGQAVIHAVLPRKSVFTRKAAGTSNNEQIVAANVDTIFICMSMNNDFNMRRLERYLSIAWDSGASPVIVLTKADLCCNAAEKKADVQNTAVGTDIVMTSGMNECGIEAIMPYIKCGRTIAFIGSSGVGKSTLINRLIGEDILETNGLRNDDKGRHTTTHRELIMLKNGAMVIDTPGMRELGMWDASDGVEKTFSDIEEVALSCRFKNCTHTNEPGCAIRAAIENGQLSEERMKSYIKLKTENSYSENSESYLAAKHKKFKEISKINKSGRK